MPPSAALLETLEPPVTSTTDAVAEAAREGLTGASKSLPPWLFYDAPGSLLFEEITTLPEYYLTRSESALFSAHAGDIFHTLGCPASRRDAVPNDGTIPIAPPSSITIAELGAGTATKTGILLSALTRLQPSVLYQPIDISPTALEEARRSIQRDIPGVIVRPRTANYITETVRIERPANARVLALYIGSSIGNFSPGEARQILTRLRSELAPGDALLLGTDLAPNPHKSVAILLAAYNDTRGVTAAFNRNILAHLNRELGANFRPDRFLHRALWNPVQSRIEIYLESLDAQTVYIPANSAGPALTLHFTPGERIHTENSHKFTAGAIAELLTACGFAPTRSFTGTQNLFAVTLATAV